MEQLLKIMSEVRPDIDFEKETELIDADILDSFDIIAIVSDVNDQFGIQINVNDLLPENFNSAAALYDLIQTMLNS
ncbi:MAG: acyl carrier protein [Lachnospiraceae bacterium]|nr:acyl carrier protein [Lachnospiraceae bacterium]